MILRFLNWLVHKLGPKPLIGFLLLLLGLGSAAYAFADSIKQLSFGLLFPLILISLIGSWLLALSKVRGWVAAIVLMITGLVISFIRVGALSNPLIALTRVAFNTLWQYLTLGPDEVVDLTFLSFAYADLYATGYAMFFTLSEWIQSLLEGSPSVNEVAIAFLWSIISWLFTAWAGWWLRRREQPLLALLPVGIFVTAILAYTWADTFILAPILFAALLLFAYVNFDQQEETWKSKKMDYPEDLAMELSATSLALVFGIVAIALIIPSIPFRGIINFVSEFTSPQIEQAEPLIESFGLEQGSIPKGDIGNALIAGLPRFQLIGAGPELSEKIVMTVEISGGTPEDEQTNLALPLYWRSLTYNEYFGLGWRSSDVVFRTYEAGEEVISTRSPYHQMIQQDFRIAQGETRYLYAAGEIVTANTDFKIAYRPTTNPTEIFDAHGDFFGGSVDQNAFRVQSLVPIVSEEILREAPEDDPEWVVDNYLSLPVGIPARVHKLAGELTTEDATRYDKVRSLESYLRGFEYTLDVDLPPVRSDLVDYFLFDLKKGYCDYYASAMAVMARGLGIPSRIAVGYVRGTYDSANHVYIVSEAEAHSWVEVYFAGVGWVPFEPTGGREPITRFESEEEIQLSANRQRELDRLVPWHERVGLGGNWTLTISMLIAMVFLSILGIALFDHFRLQNMTAIAAFSHLYQRLYRHGRRLGIHTSIENTPIEFSERLENRLAVLALGSLFGKPLQKTITQVRDFTHVYTLMRYSPLTLGMEDRGNIIRLWRSIRRRLWLAHLRHFTCRLNIFKDSNLDPTSVTPDAHVNDKEDHRG